MTLFNPHLCRTVFTSIAAALCLMVQGGCEREEVEEGRRSAKDAGDSLEMVTICVTVDTAWAGVIYYDGTWAVIVNDSANVDANVYE